MGSANNKQQVRTGKSASRSTIPFTRAEEISQLLSRVGIFSAIDSVGDPISIQDTSFRVLHQNKAHRDFIGAHVGKICYEAYVNEKAVCDECSLAMTFKDGQVHRVEKNGAVWQGITKIEIISSPLRDESGHIIAGIEVIRDITASRSAEEGLCRAEGQFRTLLEQALVGIYIYQDGVIPYVNPRGCDIFGFTQEEIRARSLETLIAESDQSTTKENIQKLLEGEVMNVHAHMHVIRKDGEVVRLETRSFRTEHRGKAAIMGTFIDVTERKKVEPALQDLQRLESLTAFASSVALEYNNILTAIIGNLTLAKMYAKPGYEVYDVLSDAEKASLRAKDLTSQLLGFSEGGTLVRKIVYVQELVKDLIRLTGESPAVNCEVSLPDNLWPVESDESQIGQAISSLLLNARNATPVGGTIRIAAENLPFWYSTALPLKQGRYVMLVIEDRGKGMSEKELRTLFDPFREGEKKLGSLGLASAYATIRKHDGIITADSSPGSGTTYRVYLPAIEEKRAVSTRSSVMSHAHRGRVLVMDDEEIVRAVISRLLQQCGYDAELAREGSEMLRIYRQAKESGKTFDAVILDLIIQEGMGGQEALKHLLSFDPDAKVIVSSGYAHNPVMTNFREYGLAGFLPKPYKLEELERVMSKVVARPQ